MLPYMEKQNWLLSYQNVEGIHQILTQMDRRTTNSTNMRFATEELKTFYTEFEEEFTSFFEDLRLHAHEKLNTL